jgi:hypothetical protein
MIAEQQNRKPQIRDHDYGGFRRERLSTCPRRRPTPAAQRSRRRSWTVRSTAGPPIWVPKRRTSRWGPRCPILIGCFLMPSGRSAFPGKTRPIRVNAGLRTKACETKPISRQRQERAGTGEVTDGTVAGTGCTNKPNLPARTETGMGRRRRPRSRRSGRLRQTNPICPAATG